MAKPDVIEAGLARTLEGRIAHDDELGIEYAMSSRGAITLRLPWAPHLTEEARPNGVSAGPLVTLLDTICGIGAMVTLNFAEAVATLDLRVDYVREADEGADCIATCSPAEVLGTSGDGAVLMRAEARQGGGGELLAYAFGRFIRRSLKNKKAPSSLNIPSTIRETADRYAELMRFQLRNDGSVVMPFRPGIVGNGSLPSLHGGALAAHLQRAAQHAVHDARPGAMRLSTANFSFLRFGGAFDTMADAEIERLGRSVGSVRAKSWQRDGQLNLTGLFTFTRI